MTQHTNGHVRERRDSRPSTPRTRIVHFVYSEMNKNGGPNPREYAETPPSGRLFPIGRNKETGGHSNAHRNTNTANARRHRHTTILGNLATPYSMYPAAGLLSVSGFAESVPAEPRPGFSFEIENLRKGYYVRPPQPTAPKRCTSFPGEGEGEMEAKKEGSNHSIHSSIHPNRDSPPTTTKTMTGA
ncbi:hypothetical protein ZHAS_00018443 [Anopheles sinensis]|uniref:Uncharacterized protein n=1 Tax=Anopheles sinensis TaxID=74873 RepID=A0A084WJM1_ANOSI|nr:hypothetical protein ZHAS_00018443 [Anopheles sinensis]